MRLRGIKSIKEANYLPIFNKRFNVKAQEQGDLHRNMPKDINLDSILCIKTERVLRNDFTIAHNNKFYQILDKINAKKVIVEERINGRIFISYKQKQLRYKEITNRPKKQVESKLYIPVALKKPYIPPQNHPWRMEYSHNYNSTYQQKEKIGQKEKELLLTVT